MKPEKGENIEKWKFYSIRFCFVKHDDNKEELFRLSIQCKQRHIFLDSAMRQLMEMVSGSGCLDTTGQPPIPRLHLTAKCLQSVSAGQNLYHKWKSLETLLIFFKPFSVAKATLEL